MHTSASLTINENASSDVPLDLNVSLPLTASVQIWKCMLFLKECVSCNAFHVTCLQDDCLCLPQDSLDRIAPEGPHYRHDDEGSDDMPAHVKVGPRQELTV